MTVRELFNSKDTERKDMDLYIANHISTMTTHNIAELVFYSCKKRWPLDGSHMAAISDRLGAQNKKFGVLNTSKILYGLRLYTSSDPAVLNLVDAITKKIKSSKARLDARGIGNSLYGLQNMSSEFVEVRQLLAVLADHIVQCEDEMKAQEVSNACYGLKSCSSEHVEVRAVVAALASKIETCSEELNAQGVASAFFGLRRMTASHEEVKRLLRALSRKAATCPYDLSSREIGNTLYGLQLMSSDHEEVCEVLRTITRKVKFYRKILNAQEVGIALYGLRNMSSSNEAVRGLLAVLAVKVAQSRAEIDAQAVGNALYGMQNMTADVPEVREMLRAIASKLSGCTDALSPQEFSIALYGMKRMSSHYADVRDVLAKLAEKIRTCDEPMSAQAIGNSFFALQHMYADHEEVAAVLSSLCRNVNTHLRSRTEPLSSLGLGNALLGLQRMSSDHRVVRSALRSLLRRAKSGLLPDMEPAHIYAGMYAMQGMCSSNVEVRDMLQYLVDLLSSCDLPVNGHTIGNAVYGLQSMDIAQEEVQQALTLLLNRLKCSSGMSTSGAGNGLFGINCLLSRVTDDTPSDAVDLLNGLLNCLLEGAETALDARNSGNHSNSTLNLLSNLVLLKHYMQTNNTLLPLSLSDRATEIILRLEELVASDTVDNCEQMKVFERSIEEKICKEYHSAVVSRNTIVSGFVLDLCISISEKNIVHNIQIVDEARSPAELNTDVLRDRYLQKVENITVSKLVLPRHMRDDSHLIDASHTDQLVVSHLQDAGILSQFDNFRSFVVRDTGISLY